MKRGTITQALAFFLIAIGPPAFLCSLDNQPEYRVSSSIDWTEGRIRIVISTSIPADSSRKPGLPVIIQKETEKKLPELIREAVLGITLNSYYSVYEKIADDGRILAEIEELYRYADEGYVRYSRDLSEIHQEYFIEFYPHIIELFIQHSIPVPVPRNIEWVPTAEFSGILIYAKGPLPVHGERENLMLNPALMIDIYDENMNIVFESRMMQPESIRRWGPAAYSGKADESAWLERIGPTPLRIMARGVFGKYYTDPIIREADAKKILYNENNRRLLEEGRILIIVEEEKINRQLDVQED
jgi:hypothetical protein